MKIKGSDKLHYSQVTFHLLVIVFLLFLNASCKLENSNSKNSLNSEGYAKIPEKVDFTFHVKPIISDRCFKCHGPDKNAIEGGLSLNTAEDAFIALGDEKDHFAIVPGDIQKSELVNRINSKDPNSLMPPPESNLELSEYEKKILTKWIDQGAEYKDHWAFIVPQNPSLPNIANLSWGNNEIDKFILAKHNENGLNPSEPAKKEKLLRRLSFNLTGLPPSIDEIQQFKNDDSVNAFEKMIDHYLGTQDYGEHMASEWMDIARYADTHGYQDDFERIMWPWRDWVIHAFNKNMPYDEFVTYQLAGDLLPNPTKEQIIATGFNRNHKITFEGGVIPEEYRVEYVEDRAITFGTAFLGLTLECARCHDHKYDPISQQEHFELFSFFNNINEKGLVSNQKETPEPYLVISEKEKEDVYDFINFQKSEMKEIPLMVMKEMEEPRPAYILDRGVYDQPTEQVYPNTPESILPFPKDLSKNRLGLSKWLFQKENPLTARVTVNRLWQRMFGTGLVSTSFDFGNQGALPSHPELLDFLAIKMQEGNWDIKKMLKYIALSATYQQSTKVTDELMERDPENKWLTHAPRLRLSAETIRDQALRISGLLNREIGGPSVKPYQPEGIWEETTGGGGGTTASYIQSEGGDLYRKSLYTFWKRTVPPPSMMTFDASSRDLCSVQRQQTNTPLQALVLLNDPQLIEASRVMAYHELQSNRNDIRQQIGALFQKATSRLPDEDEIQMLHDYYKQALSKIKSQEISAEEYLSIGAFKTEENIPIDEWAALSLTAHTILNLDETITRG